jgi:hypothetical protein
MTDETKTQPTEPAGAARFTAVSYPNVKPAAPALTLEERLTELEKVVHAIAPYSRNAEHGVVVTWLQKAGARIKGLL